MKFKLNSKLILKKILKFTPFYPISIGAHVRNLYFSRQSKKLPMNKFRNILDAGCGEGNYSRQIGNKYPHVRVTGYDIHKYDSWINNPKNVFLKEKNLMLLREKNIYDFCFCIDVLNCISKNKIVLFNICRSLKKGGYLYLHIPNKHRERILFKKYFKKYDSIFDKKFPGELYSRDELKDIITSLGFKIIEIRNTFGFFGKIAWEIDIYVGNRIVLKMFLMPLLKILSHIELISKNKEGNGILVLARK